MGAELPLLQLQYGVNAYADGIYKNYKPMQTTAYYPDPEATELKEAIAQYVGCAADMILCGSGSDELLDVYIRMHVLNQPGVRVAIAPPTYYQYANYGKRIGAKPVVITYDRSKISVALLVQHRCTPKNSIVMLDSPANPTGDTVTREQFIELLDGGYHVFADEAYYEFYGQTVVDLIQKYPKQLVVSRSFSKVCAMAGSRVGYVIAHPDLIAQFREQKLLFNVADDSQHRALFALQHMDEFLTAIEAMRAAKNKLLAEIRSFGPYVLHKSLDMYAILSHAHIPSEQLHKILRAEHKIETYLFPGYEPDKPVIRAAILQPETMKRFTQALKACT